MNLIRSGDGNAAMEAIIRITGEMQAEEDALLQIRSTRSATRFTSSSVITKRRAFLNWLKWPYKS